MGWKTSMIIIENTNDEKDEQTILNLIGKGNYVFEKETNLYECNNPKDNSINIGYYNNNIIICDDYQLTSNSLENASSLKLLNFEKNLIDHFNNAEIITVACHSVINYHGYSIIKNGEKVRLKTISSETDLIEFGSKIPEEKLIYQEHNITDLEELDINEEDEELYSEDQLMEDFTFRIAKKRLKVQLDSPNAAELFDNTIFKKYLPKKATTPLKSIIKTSKQTSKQSRLSKYIKIAFLIFLIFCAFKIIQQSIN